MNRKNPGYAVTICIFLLFAVFSTMVKVVDVRPIGPEETLVGFAGINEAFYAFAGAHDAADKISDILLVLSVMTVAGFAAHAAVQLFRDGFRAVDRRLYLYGICGILLIACYFLLSGLKINYSPASAEGALKLSYPSSHTLCYLVSPGLGMLFLMDERRKHPGLRRFNRLYAVVYALLAVGGTVARAMSGAHWLTDILGSVLLSSALLALYGAMLNGRRLHTSE